MLLSVLDAAVLEEEVEQLLLHNAVYKLQDWAASERGLQLLLKFLIPLPTWSIVLLSSIFLRVCPPVPRAESKPKEVSNYNRVWKKRPSPIWNPA
jgi:hypothetical protein